MKETVLKTRNKVLDVAKNYSLRLLFLKMIYFISGILVSKGNVFGNYYPFGLSFSASAPGKFFIPVTLGTAFGYLFPLRLATSVRYISSLIAIAAIRWTLSDLKKLKSSAFYTPIIVFLSSLITGIAVNCAGNFEIGIIWISIVEATIASVASYFFDQSYNILVNKNYNEMSYKKFIYISISLSLILFSLEDLRFWNLSLGRVLAIVVILIASYLFGAVGGALVGIPAGVMFGMSNLGSNYFSGVYAFGGMLGGLCSSFGKIYVAGVFVVTQVILSLQSNDVSKMIIGFYEVILAVGIFLLIPKGFLKKTNQLFGSFSFSKSNIQSHSQNAIVTKIKFMSKFLVGIPKVISKLSTDIFDKRGSDSLRHSCETALMNTCETCAKREFCYGVCREQTRRDLNFFIDNVIKGNLEYDSIFPKEFSLRCPNGKVIFDDLLSTYKSYLSKKSDNARAEDLKGAAGQQIYAVSSLLQDLSNDIKQNDYVYDYECAEKISKRLNDYGINISNIICQHNKSGKFFVEMEVYNFYRNRIDSKFKNIISEVCGKEFGEPIITGLGESFRVQICEKTNYKIEYNVAQHNCNGGNVCGDSFRIFEDGVGNLNVILSDGMGTGKVASQEGMLTSELMKNFMKAGMGFDCSVKLVNSSLIMNAKEEVLSTLDTLSLNLFNGKCKFMKAGAPTTYIISGKEVKKVEFSSLPIGIFNDVSAAVKEYYVTDGDYIVMLSDGATDLGGEWIEDILKNGNYHTVEELSKMIVNCAIDIRKSTHDDDITAIAIKISKNG